VRSWRSARTRSEVVPFPSIHVLVLSPMSDLTPLHANKRYAVIALASVGVFRGAASPLFIEDNGVPCRALLASFVRLEKLAKRRSRDERVSQWIGVPHIVGKNRGLTLGRRFSHRVLTTTAVRDGGRPTYVQTNAVHR